MGQVQVIDEARLTVIAGDKQGWRPGEGAQGRYCTYTDIRCRYVRLDPLDQGVQKGPIVFRENGDFRSRDMFDEPSKTL